MPRVLQEELAERLNVSRQSVSKWEGAQSLPDTDRILQIAGLFGTTLAPISGYFGWPYGVLAGFLHSSVVLYTGSPVAGMNLYNNGFSGGLIAIVLYPAIIAIARRRKPVLQEEDYFENLEHDEPITPPIVHEVVAEEEEI